MAWCFFNSELCRIMEGGWGHETLWPLVYTVYTAEELFASLEPRRYTSLSVLLQRLTFSEQSNIHCLLDLPRQYWTRSISNRRISRPLVSAFSKQGHGIPAVESLAGWLFAGRLSHRMISSITASSSPKSPLKFLASSLICVSGG